jgi:hypothetical protein
VAKDKIERRGAEDRASKQGSPRRAAGRAATDAVPGVAGAAASIGGAAVVGPIGGLAGPAASEAAKRFLRWTGLDGAFSSVTERYAEREQRRAKVAFDAAITAIANRLDAGEALRGDGFFDPRDGEGDRTNDAEAIFEGVLRAACESHEERKAERFGELFAWIASHADISAHHANHLVQLARRLTYQQMLLLGLFSTPPDGIPDWTPSGMFTHRETGLIMAILDLAQQGLLAREDHALVSSWAQINPAEMRTVLDGRLLVEAMELTSAEPEDWQVLIESFKWLGVIDQDEDATTVEAVVAPGSDSDVKRVKIDKTVVRFDTPLITLDDLPGDD